MLDRVLTFLERFVAYPNPEAAIAHTLWCAHAHLVDAFENTPRIAFLSPEPASGKSRAMELTEALTPRPVLTVNASAAYVFRKISDPAGTPTLLVDECDAIFTGSKTDSSEELRGLINSGYRKGATAGRAAVRGKEVITEDWPSFCAVALAGLNTLPDTLMTRSVVIGMKRRRRDQKLEPFRRRVNGSEADDLRLSLEEWADEHRDALADAWPDLPPEVEDRDADVWECLLAIADAAGGPWPALARGAAVKMVGDSKKRPQSLGVQLLIDIRKIFGHEDRLQSGEVLSRLHDLEESPWASLRGEPIDARFLGKLLREYGIEPFQWRVGAARVRGFARGDFLDAWSRYAPLPEESRDSCDDVTEEVNE